MHASLETRLYPHPRSPTAPTIPQEDNSREEHSLYDGEVILRYAPRSHKYSVLVKGREYKVPSVTTALGVLDKPALIPWAVNQAIELIRPAVSPGVEHAESFLEEVYEQARRQFRTVKRDAADVGTQAHVLLQLPDSDRPELGSIADARVQNCVSAGLDWLRSREVHFICQERPCYSKRYRYSGRLDGLAHVDGVLSLIDWKSSNRVYPEYRLQCAAYVRAYEEEFPEQVIGQRILIRLGKEDGAFEAHTYPRDSLRQDFNAFLAALRLHNRIRAIEQEEKLSQKLKKEGLS